MLTKIEFENFKSLKKIELSLSQINILAGGNAAGKSSVIQGLLFAKTTSATLNKNEVELNGAYNLNLGRFNDVIHSSANTTDEFTIALYSDEEKVQYSFGITNERTPYMVKLLDKSSDEDRLNLINYYNLHYLQAERLGPRKLQNYATKERLDVGCQGEFVNFVISQADNDFLKIPEQIKHSSGLDRFSTQVEAWMNTIITDFRLKVDPFPAVDMLGMSFSNETVGRISPTSTGFGISYCLPIVTAGLLATTENKSLLVVENPEAHLHPLSQSRIGRFLALIALTGVQVIVETHSEHVVNGIRIQLAQRNEGSKGRLHFITQTSGITENLDIKIKENGELSSWPKGFFDQEKSDLFELLKLKRGVEH